VILVESHEQPQLVLGELVGHFTRPLRQELRRRCELGFGIGRIGHDRIGRQWRRLRPAAELLAEIIGIALAIGERRRRAAWPKR
jgi:hypothetical protein